jgi:hypothetical protein
MTVEEACRRLEQAEAADRYTHVILLNSGDARAVMRAL